MNFNRSVANAKKEISEGLTQFEMKVKGSKWSLTSLQYTDRTGPNGKSLVVMWSVLKTLVEEKGWVEEVIVGGKSDYMTKMYKLSQRGIDGRKKIEDNRRIMERMREKEKIFGGSDVLSRKELLKYARKPKNEKLDKLRIGRLKEGEEMKKSQKEFLSTKKKYVDMYSVYLDHLLEFEREQKTNLEKDLIRDVIIRICLYRRMEVTTPAHLLHFFMKAVATNDPKKVISKGMLSKRLFRTFFGTYKKEMTSIASAMIDDIENKKGRSLYPTKDYTILILDHLESQQEGVNSSDILEFVNLKRKVESLEITNVDITRCLDRCKVLSIIVTSDDGKVRMTALGRRLLKDHKERELVLQRSPRTRQEIFSSCFWYDPTKRKNGIEFVLNVDFREFGINSNFWNKYLCHVLRENEISFQVRSMIIGDYVWSVYVNGIEYYLPIVIERKTCDDFVASLNVKNRLERQFSVLRELEIELGITVALLLERSLNSQLLENNGSSIKQVKSLIKSLNLNDSIPCKNEICILKYFKEMIKKFPIGVSQTGLIRKDHFDQSITKIRNGEYLERNNEDTDVDSKYFDDSFGIIQELRGENQGKEPLESDEKNSFPQKRVGKGFKEEEYGLDDSDTDDSDVKIVPTVSKSMQLEKNEKMENQHDENHPVPKDDDKEMEEEEEEKPNEKKRRREDENDVEDEMREKKRKKEDLDFGARTQEMNIVESDGETDDDTFDDYDGNTQPIDYQNSVSSLSQQNTQPIQEYEDDSQEEKKEEIRIDGEDWNNM